MPQRVLRKANRPTPAHVSYLFQIERMAPSYSFGTDEGRYATSGYAEYHHTEIDTVCLLPERLKGRAVSFTIMGDRRLDKQLAGELTLQNQPLGIGTLTVRGKQSNYLGSLPFDAALPIPAIILAGGYSFISLSGEALRHGSAQIRYMTFRTSFDPEDF